MLSLANAFSEEDLINFEKKIFSKTKCKITDKQKEFLDGKTPKSTLTKKDSEIVNALSNSNTELVI